MHRRKWIFDTVVLSNFLLSDSTFLLEKRYKNKGLVSADVYSELAAGFASLPQLQLIEDLIDRDIFQFTILSKKELNIYQQLIGHLGRGESSGIAIAHTRKAVMVTDDRAARSRCAQMKIPITGTIGILKASVLDRLVVLEKADEILGNMIGKGFYSPVASIMDIM